MTISTTDRILGELKSAGYDYAIATATDAEIRAGAACGQLTAVQLAEGSAKEKKDT